MNLLGLGFADLIGAVVSFVLTVLIFSYIFGDNALFRVAIHVFIGVAAAYAAVVAVYNVVWPQLLMPLIFGSQSERLFLLFPLILSGLLLLKLSSRFARFGNPAIAYLVGVGAATAIGGGVLGTLFPQASSSINLFDLGARRPDESLIYVLAQASIVLVGTLTTLIYFHFGARSRQGSQTGSAYQRGEWIEALGWVGQIFIAITFGALFAGVYTAALTALVDRMHFIGDLIFSFF
jgi:hypothetical protein